MKKPQLIIFFCLAAAGVLLIGAYSQVVGEAALGKPQVLPPGSLAGGMAATDHALAVQATQQALALSGTQAAATLQTDAAHATATVQAQSLAAEAILHQQTATAFAQQTQAAWQVQRQAGRETWGVFWRVFTAAVLLSAAATGFVLVFKFLPWIQIKYFGAQTWHGKPVMVLPTGNGKVLIADITRSLGPGLALDAATGAVATQGVFPNAELQAQVTARAQTAELILAGWPEKGSSSQPPRQTFPQNGLPGWPEGNQASFQVLPPEDPPPAILASPGTVEILDAEWRAIDD